MRVLVVDDHEDMVLLCRYGLAAAGHEVLACGDGNQAVEIVRADRPDVVLLDVMLPGLDGFGVLEALAADGDGAREVPVVMISARVGSDDRRRALEAGAVDYITKPFDPAGLSAVVERVAALDAEGRAAHRAEALAALKPSPHPSATPSAHPRGATPEAGAASAVMDPLAMLLDLAVDAIVSIDEDQRVVAFNKGAEAMFGYVAEEVLGKPLNLLIPERFRAVHGDHVREFAAGPDAARLMGRRREVAGLRKDGTEFPAEASIARVRIGNRAAFTAILRDATERHHTEAELRARARQQAAVAELGHRALSGADLASVMHAAATAIVDVLDVDLAEVAELTPDGRHVAPRARAGWGSGSGAGQRQPVGPHTLVGATMAAGDPLIVEDLRGDARFDAPADLLDEGVVAAVSITVGGPTSTFGTLGAYARHPRRFEPDDVHFLRSIANVVAAAASRVRSEQRARAYLDAAPDATVVVDTAGRIVSANSQAEALFGYQRDELIGTTVESLVPDAVRADHAGHRARYATEPRVRPMGAGLKLHARRRDGTEVPVDIMLSPVTTDEGTLVVAAVRDITERARVEAARDSFLHAVSHELRTPLTAMLGFASMLDRGEPVTLPDEAQPLASRIYANAVRLEALLTDLLDLDRLARGVLDARRRPTPLGPLLHTIIEHAAADHPVSVAVSPDDLVADVDAAQVERIVENLLANATRHTPPGTAIWVRAEQSPNGVLLAVDDAGPGVPDHLKTSIFAAFNRGANTHTPGTGIGLSLVARFADLHGGRAWVDDRPGGGASFKVLLADEVALR